MWLAGGPFFVAACSCMIRHIPIRLGWEDLFLYPEEGDNLDTQTFLYRHPFDRDSVHMLVLPPHKGSLGKNAGAPIATHKPATARCA